MKRHHLGFVAVAAFLTTQSFAVAPADQYAPFLRDTDEIIDLKTHLAWYRLQLPATSTGLAADIACAGVRPVAPKYRLATLKEALSIVDAQPHSAYVISTKKTASLFVDPGAFGQLAPSEYWTVTKFRGSAWFTVDLGTGLAALAPNDNAPRFPLCVREVP